MKKLFILLALLITSILRAEAQQPTDTTTIYHPEANAEKEIHDAVIKADKEHKHVLLQIGGNWCIWCRRFNNLVTTDADLKKQLDDSYVVLHVNYSKENKNEKVLAELGYPQRFGFPVFVVLDGKGNRIHTQNSGYLEEGQGHSKKKIAEFLNQWSPEALNPAKYKDQ